MARQLLTASRWMMRATCATIKEVFDATEEILDPHTAIGVKAGRGV